MFNLHIISGSDRCKQHGKYRSGSDKERTKEIMQLSKKNCSRRESSYNRYVTLTFNSSPNYNFRISI